MSFIKSLALELAPRTLAKAALGPDAMLAS